jgi:hypothetical protein
MARITQLPGACALAGAAGSARADKGFTLRFRSADHRGCATPPRGRPDRVPEKIGVDFRGMLRPPGDASEVRLFSSGDSTQA